MALTTQDVRKQQQVAEQLREHSREQAARLPQGSVERKTLADTYHALGEYNQTLNHYMQAEQALQNEQDPARKAQMQSRLVQMGSHLEEVHSRVENHRQEVRTMVGAGPVMDRSFDNFNKSHQDVKASIEQNAQQMKQQRTNPQMDAPQPEEGLKQEAPAQNVEAPQNPTMGRRGPNGGLPGGTPGINPNPQAPAPTAETPQNPAMGRRGPNGGLPGGTPGINPNPQAQQQNTLQPNAQPAVQAPQPNAQNVQAPQMQGGPQSAQLSAQQLPQQNLSPQQQQLVDYYNTKYGVAMRFDGQGKPILDPVPRQGQDIEAQPGITMQPQVGMQQRVEVDHPQMEIGKPF